ncbi:MAG: hypothetical protein ACP5NX_02840, partial [Candidatus Bilamarchaeaceae archaeon]
KNTPTSKARSAALGLAELFGKARAVGDMRSPLEGKKCAYWYVMMEEYRQSRKHGGWQRSCWFDSSDKAFYLEDDTGKMLIDPKGSIYGTPANFKNPPTNIMLPGDPAKISTYGGIAQPGMPITAENSGLPKSVFAFISSLPPDYKRKFSNPSHRRIQFVEYRIEDGDPLYVLGSIERTENNPNTTSNEQNLVMRNGRDKILHISASDEKKLLGDLGWLYPFLMLAGFALSIFGFFNLMTMLQVI